MGQVNVLYKLALAFIQNNEEHLRVFWDERTERIYVPKNTGKLTENRTFKALYPGKKDTDIILLRSEIALRSRWALLGASDVKFAFC